MFGRNERLSFILAAFANGAGMTSGGSAPRLRPMKSLRRRLLLVLLALRHRCFPRSRRRANPKNRRRGVREDGARFHQRLSRGPSAPGRRARLSPIRRQDRRLTAGSRSMPRSNACKRFQEQLAKLDATQTEHSAPTSIAASCQTAIAGELFQIVDMSVFEKNPMIYAGALDVNIYIKRDFKPLEDRVRDIVTIEDQAANIMIAAKTNLAAGPAQTVRRARDPDRERLGRFPGEGTRRGAQGGEGRGAHGRFRGFEPESRRGAARLRRLANERKIAEGDGGFRARRGEISARCSPERNWSILPPDKILAHRAAASERGTDRSSPTRPRSSTRRKRRSKSSSRSRTNIRNRAS